MSFDPIFDLDSINGTNGFTITGIDFDAVGAAVSDAGDINGDGISDIIVGAPNATLGTSRSGRGGSYVIFGGSNVGSDGTFDLASLRGRNGFSISGVLSSTSLAGSAVSSAGDVNNDGFDDVIVGAPRAADPFPFGGQSYVVFGGPSGRFQRNLSLDNLNGRNGFNIVPDIGNSTLGTSVSDAGDFNGDGIADLIVSAPTRNTDVGRVTGRSYVVFGGKRLGQSGSFDVADLNGQNGFAINGADSASRAGASVSSAGDINGDGKDDLIIGAPLADPDDMQNVGESYVVFGQESVGDGSFELTSLDGINGFTFEGENRSDRSGVAVSGVGDVNGDGLDDILVGADSTGDSYVVFGNRRVGSRGIIKASQLNGRNGFVIEGPRNIAPGRYVSEAGDINNDGIDDLLIGTSFGGAYAVFGSRNIGRGGTVALADVIEPGSDVGVLFTDSVRTNAAGEIVVTGSNTGRAVSGAGDFNNDGIDDVIVGDPSASAGRGRAFVVFGQDEDTQENTPPEAVNDRFEKRTGQLSQGDVLKNDTDADGDRLTTTLVSDVRRGNLTFRSNGTFSYRPNAGFVGRDQFTYELSDGNGGTDRATVALITTRSNRAPRANNDVARLNEDRAITISVLKNDRDQDGDKLTLRSVSRPRNGRAIRRNNGTILYRPNRGFSGRDQFTYQISDGEGGSDTGTVRVTVVPKPNRAPRAQNDRVRVLQNQATSISVLKNDRDPDNDELTLRSVSRPRNGRAIRRNDGTVLYRPNRGFSGTDRFTYQVSDGQANRNATVFVTVAKVNATRANAQQPGVIAQSEDLITGERVDAGLAMEDDLLNGGLKAVRSLISNLSTSDLSTFLQSASDEIGSLAAAIPADFQLTGEDLKLGADRLRSALDTADVDRLKQQALSGLGRIDASQFETAELTRL